MRRRSRSPWPTRITWVLAIALLAVIIVVGVGKLRRRDALAQWRRGLEVTAGSPAWPEWSANWPALPPASARQSLGDDFHGPYAFVARRSDVVRQIPCYCGCVNRGHRSVLDCFVTGFQVDGRPIWTAHAYDCPLCIHVVREVMLMTAVGMNVPDIRAAIDTAYAEFGKPTTTPHAAHP